ncbi:hypothetical protein, partial [Lactobacillus crispatus]|uniref:hypothetical protein n=1 Tax=Lactobacillus crispatus TaxID=47770 RepID=UPI001C9DF7DE
MLEESHKYIIIKNNIGEQQNIKFPKKYRDLLNRIFLDTLEIEEDEKIFDIFIVIQYLNKINCEI